MIQLEKACRRFEVGDQLVHALAGVDLSISGGEYVSIVGPSGSGKSTLLNAIGFVFQFLHLVARMSATENVELPMTLSGVPALERRQRVDAALHDYGLSDRAKHRQRQRIAIARATVMRPSVLLADEPTGDLDRRSGGDVVEILEGLNRDGITLLVVTHDPMLAARATRSIHMVDGAIESDQAV